MKVKEIKSTDYSIFISSSSKSLSEKFLHLTEKKYSKYVILCDENTRKYCLKSLIAGIDLLSEATIILIKSGEKNKNIKTCEMIWTKLLKLKADRKTLLINLGGGVIGDIGGFAASTYKRGIDYVQIPTTLLAQVDASIGGKTGIDLKGIKNAIGLFSTPQFVFVCSDFLKTLPKNQVDSGWAELIKHLLIADAAGWKKIKSKKIPKKISNEMIHQSISIKNKIVMEDFKELLRNTVII